MHSIGFLSCTPPVIPKGKLVLKEKKRKYALTPKDIDELEAHALRMNIESEAILTLIKRMKGAIK
jgi:hypothetical protein